MSDTAAPFKFDIKGSNVESRPKLFITDIVDSKSFII